MEKNIDLYVKKNILKVDIKNKVDRFRLQGKTFFLTYPKCNVSKDDALDALCSLGEFSFIMISQERHEDDSRHLHVLLQYSEKKSICNATYFDMFGYHGNYQTCRDSDKVKDYISKEDDEPVVKGIYSSNKQSAVQKKALLNKKILENPLTSLVDSGEISIYCYKQIRQAKTQYLLDSIRVSEYIPRRCIWIFGAPGIGKSRYVRDTYPNEFYSKPMNKWWDGYENETCVVLDDLEMQHSWLSHHLKIWADVYSFTGEVKAGYIKPNYNTFIVTSNYLPKAIWSCKEFAKDNDYVLVEALNRRFIFATIVDNKLQFVDINDY